MLLENLITLFMLVMLQAVLGFDNLLYISLESKNAPPEKQAFTRQVGIGLAIILRIVLLFVLVNVIKMFQDPIFHFPFDESILSGHFTVHSIIDLLGGVFIMYTATKEIWHMMSLEIHGHGKEKKSKTTGQVIFMIVIMNIVFSFDSILSAMALTETFWVMALAIVIGGILMIILSDTVARFLQKNRMYEVLGLFILFLVGIMLLTEGGHLAHIYILGNEITPMSKTTFYFILVILVLVDLVQGRYKRKISMEMELKSTEKVL